MIVVADAARLPFPDRLFDLIFTSPPWDDLDVVTRARPELRRVLRRNGQMVMVLPHLISPALATLAVTDRDWTRRTQWAIPKPTVNKGWVYRSLPDSLVAEVLTRTKAKKVLDPFCGTGTVVKVAKAMGRIAAGCDISPAAARLAAA